MAGSEIILNDHVVDPSTQQKGGSQFVKDAVDSDYVLVHCKSFLTTEQKAQLAKLNVCLLSYPAENTYLCRYEPQDLEKIRALPFVVYANIYHPDVVVQRNLLDNVESSSSANPDQLHHVHIVPHEDCYNKLEEVKNKLVQKVGVNANNISVESSHIRAHVNPEQIAAIAKLDEVRTIEQVHTKTPANNCARKDINADLESNPGYVEQFAKLGSGKGETIAVFDTGIDEKHKAFSNGIKKIISYRKGNPKTWNNPDGHGTHVAASAAGRGSSNTFGAVTGVAPDADLVIQVEMDKSDMNVVLKDAYDQGARVHNNSWNTEHKKGDFIQGDYDISAQIIDRWIRSNPDMTVLFAAGNEGRWGKGDGDIGHEPSAKNVITVGACESTRRMEIRANGDYVYNETKPPGNPNQWAKFSSTGPCKNTKRIKPDVLAPGTAILSARPKEMAQKSLDEAQETSGVCSDNEWYFTSGTSMATPLVSGCCAIIRSKIKDKCGNALPAIPNTLIKAIIVNGATPLNTHAVMEGFGRVNLAKSLICLQNQPGCGFWPMTKEQAAMKVKQKESLPDIKVAVIPPKQYKDRSMPKLRLTVTLVWNDSVSQNAGLVDQFSLLVGSDITGYRYGNADPDPKAPLEAVKDKPWKASGKPDPDNNVQRVIIDDVRPIPGFYNIKVTAERIFDDAAPQQFALAWHLEELCKENDPQYAEYAELNSKMPSQVAWEIFERRRNAVNGDKVEVVVQH